METKQLTSLGIFSIFPRPQGSVSVQVENCLQDSGSQKNGIFPLRVESKLVFLWKCKAQYCEMDTK